MKRPQQRKKEQKETEFDYEETWLDEDNGYYIDNGDVEGEACKGAHEAERNDDQEKKVQTLERRGSEGFRKKEKRKKKALSMKRRRKRPLQEGQKSSEKAAFQKGSCRILRPLRMVRSTRGSSSRG